MGAGPPPSAVSTWQGLSSEDRLCKAPPHNGRANRCSMRRMVASTPQTEAPAGAGPQAGQAALLCANLFLNGIPGPPRLGRDLLRLTGVCLLTTREK